MISHDQALLALGGAAIFATLSFFGVGTGVAGVLCTAGGRAMLVVLRGRHPHGADIVAMIAGATIALLAAFAANASPL
ncbi:hypothetical protein [Paraburkholderia sp. J10-1]|uniref:hypothetical protein n=1 Tax=Paraburkholderia sp. J10-1 TaxID=2805430 RepID=UPI002AB65CA6|nr:hypothetical protein [Paraburkholderia sp. J10-1]